VSATHAKVAVAWSATAPDGGSHDGNAEVSLLVVRSGSGAITEVLVAFPVPAAIAAPTTTLLRAVLDRLSQLLEGRAV
jgi:hypothetical protein